MIISGPDGGTEDYDPFEPRDDSSDSDNSYYSYTRGSVSSDRSQHYEEEENSGRNLPTVGLPGTAGTGQGSVETEGPTEETLRPGSGLQAGNEGNTISGEQTVADSTVEQFEREYESVAQAREEGEAWHTADELDWGPEIDPDAPIPRAIDRATDYVADKAKDKAKEEGEEAARKYGKYVAAAAVGGAIMWFGGKQ